METVVSDVLPAPANRAGTANAPAASAGTAPVTRWSQPPFFMLRVAGLPFDAVEPLRTPRSMRWAAQVLELEDRLDAGREQISELLEAAVAGIGDRSVRAGVLRLRRDVYNRRPPRQADIDAARAVLAPAAANRLDEWLSVCRRWDETVAAGESILHEETVDGRRYLRKLAHDPVLRHGILLASPSLDQYLPGYLAGTGDTLGKRARRIERSVLEYVYRTACKTSPFSTLTPVGLGRFGVTAGELLSVTGMDLPRHGHVRLNMAVLARVSEMIMEDPARRRDLPATLANGWRSHQNRIRFVRRKLRTGDTDGPVTIDPLSEHVFYLSGGQALDHLIAMLESGGTVRTAELVDGLRRLGADERDAQEYVAHMLRLGLLTIPALRVDIHHADPLGAFREGLAALDRPWASEVADRLGAAADRLAAYPGVDLDRRRDAIAAVRGEFDQLKSTLNSQVSATPRTLLYEDVALGEADVVADAQRWNSRVVPALQGLARMLPVFDMTLSQRATTKGFFRARYGRGASHGDVTQFVQEYNQDCYEEFLRSGNRRQAIDDGEYVPQPNWFRLPELTAVDAARRELIHRMRELAADLPADAEELVLDDAFVDSVAGLLPDDLGEFWPRSFFLQVADDGVTPPRAMLNRAYSGLTLPFSRFAHCFTDARHRLTEELRRTVLEMQPEGVVFAELTGGFDTNNLNLHPAVLPFELVCPGDVSFRPPEEQIPLADLVIVDDERSNQLHLRSRRLDVVVVPVYLGFLLPLALPEVQRVLLTFSYNMMAAPDFWGGVPFPADSAAGLRRRPRVSYRDLVLHRRQWIADAHQLPGRAASSGEAEWYRDWRRWVRDAGIPDRVFVSSGDAPADEPPDASGQLGRPGGTRAAEGSRLTKPQFVDFGSVFSLTMLDHVLRSTERSLVMSEMLPDPEQLWLRSPGGAHVAELVVELDAVRRTS